MAHSVLLQVYCNHLYHITTKTAHSRPVSVSHCPRSTMLQALGCMDHLLVIHDATHWTGISFVCHTSETFTLFLLSVFLSIYKSWCLHTACGDPCLQPETLPAHYCPIGTVTLTNLKGRWINLLCTCGISCLCVHKQLPAYLPQRIHPLNLLFSYLSVKLLLMIVTHCLHKNHATKT